MFDEEMPKKKPGGQFPRVLDNMSVTELEEYTNDLRDEITRVENDIKKKKASRDAAASIFK